VRCRQWAVENERQLFANCRLSAKGCLLLQVARPDGIVVWASEAAPNHEEIAQAASRWFDEAKNYVTSETSPGHW